MTSQVIENITEDDEKSLFLLQPREWGDIVPVFRFYASKKFCLPIKIEENSQIIGVGAAIFFDRTAWLAHIIVREDRRNKGLGKIIVDDLLEITSKCESVSLIATELGLPLYAKAGFREQTEYIFFDNEKTAETEDLDLSVGDLSQHDIRDVLSMDERIYGEKREDLLIDKLQGGIVFKRENSLRGCFLPELGEGLILAEDDEAGIELMKLRMTLKNSAAVPKENEKGIEALVNSGFAEKKRAKRMIYGKEFPWCPENVWNRIGGNFG